MFKQEKSVMSEVLIIHKFIKPYICILSKVCKVMHGNIFVIRFGFSVDCYFSELRLNDGNLPSFHR